MTDAYIEEIYILAREAFNGGQTKFHVQALPFRMTTANMTRHRDSPWYPFWSRLKEGYDSFEATGKPPIVKVCGKQYMVNVSFPGPADPGPGAACPIYAKIDPASIQAIDGVPPTLLASLGKGETAASGEKGSSRSWRRAWPHAAPSNLCAPVVKDMSASPVISRARLKTRRDRCHANAKGARRAGLYGFRCPISPAPPTAQARAAAGTAQPVNYQGAIRARAHLRAPRTRPCAVLCRIGRSGGTAGPECASEAEPLGQGRQAPGRRSVHRAVHWGRPH